MKCVVCDKQMQSHGEVFDDITNRTFTILKCQACHTLSVAGNYSDDEIRDFYQKSYYSYGEDKTLARKVRSAVIRSQNLPVLRRVTIGLVPGMPSFPAGKHKPKLLDLGTGSGDGIIDLASLGWELHGTEIGTRAHSLAEKRGICMHSHDLHDHPNIRYDAIRMWHTLEHVPMPSDMLAACRTLLLPGGELIIGVPNNTGLLARLFGLDWYHLDTPRHLHTFNTQSIRSLLEKSGFRVTEIKTYADRGLLASIEKKVQRKRLNVTFKDRTPLIIAEMPLNKILGWSGVGDLMYIRATQDSSS